MDCGESAHREFLRRVEAIPLHGLGLSVDIYSPNLPSLRRSLLERQVPPAYFEIFRNTTRALASTRRDIGDARLTYHGEGLWMTQPGVTESELFRQAVDEAGEHLNVLQSAWLNHECAAKFFAGHCYGTYLPPLYTRGSAEVVAENAIAVQHQLDQQGCLSNGSRPLVLLEMPPLTYFVAGTLPIPGFFHVICNRAPCGLVLDIGHLWTVYRYTGAHRTMSLHRFVETFLDTFPLDRVVEIHVAGLDIHESIRAHRSQRAAGAEDSALPAWTDAHEAPIPPVLFEMLDQVLCHPQLVNLKGLALEVDTKPAGMIVDEFAAFSRRYAPVFPEGGAGKMAVPIRETQPAPEPLHSASTRETMEEAYERYVHVLLGKAEPSGPEWSQDPGCTHELDLYRSLYLPYEILHWSGEVEDMFVDSCRLLRERGIALEGFVTFWFRDPQPPADLYDFFLLKVDRFVAFIREVAPDVGELAVAEAEGLRQAYRLANEPQETLQLS
ncbi:MAG: DUF692 family protein [Nitrospira sp.]|nr:DUF692 family protein [Nitrospira sp.]